MKYFLGYIKYIISFFEIKKSYETYSEMYAPMIATGGMTIGSKPTFLMPLAWIRAEKSKQFWIDAAKARRHGALSKFYEQYGTKNTINSSKLLN